MLFTHKTRLHQTHLCVCLLSVKFWPWQDSIRAGFVLCVCGIALRRLCAVWLNGQAQREVGMASVEKLRQCGLSSSPFVAMPFFFAEAFCFLFTSFCHRATELFSR
jgi:hypothetical protein